MRESLCLIVIDARETLDPVARQLALWVANAGLAFVAVRPLRPTVGRGQ